MMWAVVRAADCDDMGDAYGPFSSRGRAEQFADDFGDYVAPGFVYYVVELNSVREGERQIRQEKADGT